MKIITVAATQMACSWNVDENIQNAENLVRDAAANGANVVLIQELFETPYFCIEQSVKHQQLAKTLTESTTIKRFAQLANELSVVLPISWYERSGPAFFNSVAMIDATGDVLGVYRKTHIPNSIGYQEKTYFSPGDTGFKVWDTAYCKIGLGICWDQWFPEAARCMALQGAEMLLYPTAIGSEPDDATLDSKGHWQNVMCGHAAANIVPVVASNRIGTEKATASDVELNFYGSSFIADQNGNLVKVANRTDESVSIHEFDLDEIRGQREAWGVYRDRRPEYYSALLTLDGQL